MSYCLSEDGRFEEIAKRAHATAQIILDDKTLDGAIKNLVLFNLGYISGLCNMEGDSNG